MDHGYRGLYGGLGMRDLRERKRLKPKQHVLDHMGSTELAAKLFRATQTEEKLRRENVRNKDHANRIHNEVGRKVRKTIHELGGTMPENLPVAESIKKVESREKKQGNYFSFRPRIILRVPSGRKTSATTGERLPRKASQIRWCNSSKAICVYSSPVSTNSGLAYS